jgi:hypothetical protein
MRSGMISGALRAERVVLHAWPRQIRHWFIGAYSARRDLPRGRRPATLTHCDSHRPPGMLLLAPRPWALRVVGFSFPRRRQMP